MVEWSENIISDSFLEFHLKRGICDASKEQKELWTEPRVVDFENFLINCLHDGEFLLSTCIKFCPHIIKTQEIAT